LKYVKNAFLAEATSASPDSGLDLMVPFCSKRERERTMEGKERQGKWEARRKKTHACTVVDERHHQS